MITIAQWRIAIGSFHPRGQSIKISLYYSQNNKSEYLSNGNKLNVEKGLVVLILMANLNISFLIMMKMLIDGDVESNPSYNISKLVKASFHQGHVW